MLAESTSSLLPPDPPFWTKTAWIQLRYGIWVNMTAVGLGLTFGFPSVAIPQLLAADSSIKIDLDQESWIASALPLSSPIGCLLCGVLMDKYGRRLVLVLCEVPMCIGWFYAGFAPSAKHIIIARLISGVGYGMALIAPRAYINEITLPNMRGVLGALPNFFIAFGLSLMAGLATFLSWRVVCHMCGCFTVGLAISKIFLPDSPYYLLLNATKSYARVNLQRFRSSKFNISAELETLNDFKKENNIRSLTFLENMQLVFRPATCKPYAIISAYLCMMQLAGVHVVIVWAIEMLESSNISMDASMGNFILSVSRIAFAPVTLILLYKIGRRVIALISAIGVGVVALVHCIYLFTYTQPSIFPLFSYMAYFGFCTVGYYSIPFLMMFELLPLQVRGIMSAVCFSQFNLLVFFMNKIYPYMRSELGLAITMGLFGLMSLLGAVIIYLILPETKDLTLQEIEEYFNSRRSTLVSQRSVMSSQLIRHGSKIYKSNVDMAKPRASVLPGSPKPRRTQSKDLDLKPKITKPKEKPKTMATKDSLAIKEVDEENTEEQKQSQSKETIKDTINKDKNSTATRQVKDEVTTLQEKSKEKGAFIGASNDIPKGDDNNDPDRSKNDGPSQIKHNQLKLENDQTKETQNKDSNQSKDPNQSTSKDPNQNKETQSNAPSVTKDPNQTTSKDPNKNKESQSNAPTKTKDPNQTTSNDPNQNKETQSNARTQTKDPNQTTSKEPNQNKETQSNAPTKTKDPNQTTSKDPNQNKETQSNAPTQTKDPNQTTSKDPNQNKETQSNAPNKTKDPNQTTSKDPNQNKETQSNARTQTKDPNQTTSKEPNQNRSYDPNTNKDEPNQNKDDQSGQAKK